jgi:hypothetical protein
MLLLIHKLRHKRERAAVAAVPVLLYNSLETKPPTMTRTTSAIVDEHLMIIRTVSCTSRIEQTCCRERVTVARVTTMSGSSQRGCSTNKRLQAHPTGRRETYSNTEPQQQQQQRAPKRLHRAAPPGSSYKASL